MKHCRTTRRRLELNERKSTAGTHETVQHQGEKHSRPELKEMKIMAGTHERLHHLRSREENVAGWN
jgi:hypothetical protein